MSQENPSDPPSTNAAATTPPKPATGRRIEIYDTTLRDGTQGEGVAFSLVDKLKIVRHLDQIGVDFAEGGFPLSNPKDVAFFEETAKEKYDHIRICAFGMTRRRGVEANKDPGMLSLVGSGADVTTIVGKTWDLHVDEVLRVSRQENLDMIRESLAFCGKYMGIFYDAEHFFDGYKANPDYARQTLQAAIEGGATRLILCDTNGGSLPAWIVQAISEVRQFVETVAGPDREVELGIHTHNDGGVALANSLAAIEAGALQVQGTINGIGERCGNVDLTSVAANLKLKMGYDCLNESGLSRLTEISRYVYELANLNLIANQPFVGGSAFAHKGGMHVHAVQRVAHSYEHITPESVGNTRRILVSELSGASNVVAKLGGKFDSLEQDKALQRKVLERVQDLENNGYQFEAATASFELMLHEEMGNRPTYFELDHYRCVILKRDSEQTVTEGIVKARVGDVIEHRVAEGDGPVNALDGAMRKCLYDHFPQLRQLHLADYKVRVVNPTAESAAKVRVVIEFVVKDSEGNVLRDFATIGVNENIVDASWQALTDAFVYHLMEEGTPGS